MKVRVCFEFYDSKAKKLRMPNEVFDVTVARFNEIIRKGHFVEAIEEKPKKAE